MDASEKTRKINGTGKNIQMASNFAIEVYF